MVHVSHVRPHTTHACTPSHYPCILTLKPPTHTHPHSGGDGLVKVWTIRTGECVTTLDGHTDRVWALTTALDGGGVVSGGGDSIVTFWKVRVSYLMGDHLLKNFMCM